MARSQPLIRRGTRSALGLNLNRVLCNLRAVRWTTICQQTMAKLDLSAVWDAQEQAGRYFQLYGMVRAVSR